jgi:S1-C subfamily serine protease
VTGVDWVALGVVGLAALIGFKRGLVASALSVIGIVVGAVVGARIAPHILGGSSSPYAPLVALAGAAVLAFALEGVASFAGAALRRALRLTPLALADSAGGLVLGAVAGLAAVWMIGVVALFLPGQRGLRREAQRSEILQRLNEIVSPASLLDLLARFDPFPTIAGPQAPDVPPTAAVLDDPRIRAAAPSVVRVLGTACGLGIEGSGWVAQPGVVVTAAHVVAGETDTVVQSETRRELPAHVVSLDARNDIAILRVEGLAVRPLVLIDPVPGAPVALVGYPLNGPLDATPGRIGRTATVVTKDAFGHGVVLRRVTALGGHVQHGDSGGPAIDSQGRVQSTVFASRRVSTGGYGVPASVVRRALARAGSDPVSTGSCAS